MLLAPGLALLGFVASLAFILPLIFILPASGGSGAARLDGSNLRRLVLWGEGW